MKCFLGIGANLGNRLASLESAAQRFRGMKEVSKLRASPVFQTPPLLPPGAHEDWNIPFLNAVLELEWKGSARELLDAAKKAELELGREPAPRWAPRVIDIDILAFGSEVICEPGLTVPHPEAKNRNFVLDPWKHLCPTPELRARARELGKVQPLWMGVLNLTPDSFSDGGKLEPEGALLQQLECLEASHVQILDLGAESTRPGATVVSAQEEWERLRPALELLRERCFGKIFRPWISVDTRYPETAEKALELGADIWNDVGGLTHPQAIPLLRKSDCQYVLMHSLSVPANRALTLDPWVDPVAEIRRWACEKLEALEKSGVRLERVILDPGIGFGKTAVQSLAILRRIEELESLPVRLLVGHSRKSFMQKWASKPAGERDGFSIGSSVSLAQRGVEILRVHEADQHADAFQAYLEVSCEHS